MGAPKNRQRAAPPSGVLSAHERYARLHRQRYRILPGAVWVGVLSGGLAVGFRLALEHGEQIRSALLEHFHLNGPAGLWQYALFVITCIVVAAALVRFVSPEASGSGIPHLKAVLLGRRTFCWLRLIPVKFVSGVIGITGGLALGREGPTVQMAGAIGSGVAGYFGSDTDEQRVMISAGSGAGLTAAFNAPLSGMTFVLEELNGQATSLEFFAAAIACMIADMICRLCLGQSPVFHLLIPGAPAFAMLPAFALTGMVCGLVGVAFNRSLLSINRLSALALPWRVVSWVICGGVIAIAGWFSPLLPGGGQVLLNGVLATEHPRTLAVLGLFFVARFMLTLLSYGTGSAGGIFSPVLLLGALAGLIMGSLQHLLLPELANEPAAFAVVGMAACFTAVVRAPLTAMVLMIEMTGNYTLILPLFIGSFTAMLVADTLHDLPIYEALLERDLQKST